MKFEIGRDALGRWAWMLLDDAGTLLASEDDYREAQFAMRDALASLHRHERLTRRQAERP